MAMKIRGVLETCLYVDNLEAARDFYESVLGLEFHSEQPGRHCFFRCGNQMLLLFRPEASHTGGELPPHGAVGPGHVAFAVPDEELDAWRDHLESQGVAIELSVGWPHGGRSLYFRDPAGNSLELASPQIWQLVSGT
ncbi:MAG: bleomycin resistance protein [Pirellulaceae bacterium]|nr:MAG: bleomycin resistance protein [Pirellulaceae bacterium]